MDLALDSRAQVKVDRVYGKVWINFHYISNKSLVAEIAALLHCSNPG